MSELPSGWAACTLGDIVERIETGKSVKCEERPPQGDENGLVKISAVTWGEFDEQESKTLFDSSHLKPEEKIQLGDFLISRANTLELVGSCVLVKKISKSLYLSDKVLRLVLPDEAKSWLLVCLRSQAGRKQIENLATGNQLSMRNISQQALREIRIPLPPLAEQTRIAAKLDELLAQVNTLKARIDGIPALLKRFRQSVLAAAVSGRLTEEWRGVQSGGELQCDSADLPTGWSVVPLGRYAINHDGARKPISAKERESRRGGYPYFGATGQIDSIDGYTHDGEFVLVGEDGANLLTRAKPIAFLAKGQIWVNNHAHVIASPPGHSNAYLAIYLNTLDITPWVSGSAQPKLNQKNMNEIPVHIPPPAEQTEIVRRVEQLFAFADQLEAKVNEAKTRIDRLTRSILAKAFRGELVPQDPNDEPASVLLERIQAQRTSALKARRGRKTKENA
ncbi:restriction endonuclease subunit S [Azotobacter salinestris]|uniref:restriction endonuclease subunit S n=1 Tax=Azotobacter salinestris TaxID=69964 RepID=UPI0012669221|nr:restriction endonuclease subunit S [Azotobacter salinestris]